MRRRRKAISCFALAVILFLLPVQVKAAESETKEIIEELVQAESEENVSEPEEQKDTDAEIEQKTEIEAKTENEQKTETEERNDAEQRIEPEKEDDTERETPVVTVSELDLGDYLDKMTVGEKQLLSVTVLPTDASNADITYSSSDTNIATVNGMGRITALMPGNTTITVSAGGVEQSFGLQITEEESTTIPVADIEIGEHESELEVDKTMSISGTVLPSDATETTITYTSSDPAVATVSSTGEVKGISKGNVTITLSAGGFSKSIPLAVKVATAGITMNKEYLVLKTDETYQLSAQVLPAEAEQAIIYQSADTAVASVSSGGLVTAKNTGSTAIIVSNGDLTIAVSVIVNKSIEYDDIENVTEQETFDEKTYVEEVLASEMSVIDAAMLYHLYDTQQVLRIIGEGYIIEIDGKDIINFNNELYTDISLEKEGDKWNFILNNGNELCGGITLYLEEPEGKYLYLYNTAKEKYEWIQTENMGGLRLTTSGEYLLSESKIKVDTVWLLYTAVAGIIVLLGLGAGYILVKKRYWFW